MIDVKVDSVYTEKDGRISVHATLLSSGGQSLGNVAVQVKDVADLKDALRAKVAAAAEQEQGRIDLKAAAQTTLDELALEIRATREEAKDGANLDR
jgi:hypothetical protein